MKRIAGRLSYANVVATMALFLALGGVGYAATQLPKNSVGTKQLKNGAVTAKKLGKNAKGALAGPTGPTGQQGPQGIPGTAGEPGSARAYARVSLENGLDTAHSKGVIAVVGVCKGGDVVECASPPPIDEETADFCFKLGFEPNTVEVTPIMERSYAPDAATHVEARAPGRAWDTNGNYGGCKAGYRDAEVRAWRGTGDPGTPVKPGFFVVFN